MLCRKEIDFKKRPVQIENRINLFAISQIKLVNSIELFKKTIAIIEKSPYKIEIKQSQYKIIRFNVPVPFNFVILQNDYLPLKGEYFLN